LSPDRRSRSSLRVLPVLLLVNGLLAGPALAQQALDPPTQLPPVRPALDAPIPAAPDPAPVREVEGVAGPGDDVEAGSEDETVLDEEALEAAAALRRPSFDEAEARICEQSLREAGAQFEVIEPVGEDEPHCGAERGVALSSVAGIMLKPSVTVRCAVGLAFAEWAGNVLVPMARLYLDDKPSAIGTSGDYECRWRRGGSDDAAFSQHAFANAIDVASISFEKRGSLPIVLPEENSNEARLFQAAIRGGACAYFTTVLGPMTNAAHADHLHFDMAERRGGFRLCE
jgi:hypothetical protein